MSPRILVVEGDPDQAVLVDRVFRDLGRDGQLAALLRDGEAAVAWLSRALATAPTLVLLDLDLPGDEGFDLLRRIRRAWRGLPVVVQSGDEDDGRIRRAYELGANSYIVKPRDLGEATDAYGKLLRYWTGANVAPEPAAPAAPARTTGRVLLVEDDPALLEALASALEGQGHAVVRAGNGEEALARLRADPAIRLVVLDAVLPVMDGWALRDAMKGDPRWAGLPVVVISAYEDRLRERPIDSAAFFPKPFPVEEFLRSIARFGA